MSRLCQEQVNKEFLMPIRINRIFLCLTLILLLCPNKGIADTETPNFTIYIGKKPGSSQKENTVSEKILPASDKEKTLILSDDEKEDFAAKVKATSEKSNSKQAVKVSPPDFSEQKAPAQTNSAKEGVAAKAAPDKSSSNSVNKASPPNSSEQKKPTLADSKKETPPTATPAGHPDTALPAAPGSAQIELPEEKDKNKVSETFAPDKKEKEPLWGLPDDYSLIFDSRTTVQELAIVPTFYRSRTYGFNWGLRIFTFSPDNSGYYISTSLVNKLSTSLFKWDVNYRQPKPEKQEIKAYGQFSNYFEPYYDRKGMGTSYQDEKKLYTYKLNLRYQRIFKEYQPFFYGIEVGSFFLKQRPPDFDEDLYFSTEFLVYFKLTGGYDNRNNWKNPEKGNYHQLALSCVPILGRSSSYCLIDADLRSYIPLPIQLPVLKQSVLALRAFTGTSLIAPASYSISYTLGGSHILRGFTDKRFRGDKIYFGQSELRLPLWKNIVSGVVFFELGEVAGFDQNFSGFRWDYGLGFRLGMPPTYNIKLRLDLGFGAEKKRQNSP